MSITQIEQLGNGKPQTISTATFTAIVDKIGQAGFVPPVSYFALGRKALRLGYVPRSTWPADMVTGWNFEGPRCYAEAMSQPQL